MCWWSSSRGLPALPPTPSFRGRAVEPGTQETGPAGQGSGRRRLPDPWVPGSVPGFAGPSPGMTRGKANTRTVRANQTVERVKLATRLLTRTLWKVVMHRLAVAARAAAAGERSYGRGGGGRARMVRAFPPSLLYRLLRRDSDRPLAWWFSCPPDHRRLLGMGKLFG